MVERVPSDHDAVETVRATAERVGRTGRYEVVLPPETPISTGEVVRLSLSGTARHALVTTDYRDRTLIRGAFENARLAREEGAGRNHLTDWIERAGIPEGGSVLVDVVAEDALYGLRAPGERVVYDAVEGPSDSLAAIAEDVSERSE